MLRQINFQYFDPIRGRSVYMTKLIEEGIIPSNLPKHAIVLFTELGWETYGKDIFDDLQKMNYNPTMQTLSENHRAFDLPRFIIQEDPYIIIANNLPKKDLK